MKLPLSALRAWVDLPCSAAELAQRLTQSGFEVEAIESAAPPFTGVLVAKILSAERHPRAEKLQLCRVATAAGAAGEVSVRQIVCGASNARAGLVSALATVGAVLPGGLQIKAAQLRGVESQGMLCSARELGMGESSEGILELPEDLALGTDLRAALDLDDPVFEVNVTANRGDALSVLGMAREVAALFALPLKTPAFGAGAAEGAVSAAGAAAVAEDPGGERLPIELPAQGGAGRLVARVIRGVDNTRASPFWLRERLRRSGLRSISPVVDVTNWVMLELGQPMHAYDRRMLEGAMVARWAQPGERLELLDGREITLEPDVLVIADHRSVIGLAGIMGGERSGISPETHDLALEVAWFVPQAIAGRARRYGLMTDASQRFERGVDFRVQERAVVMASDLITQLVGGKSGPIALAEQPEALPQPVPVPLRHRRIERLLGAEVTAAAVEQRLRALGMGVHTAAAGWRVEPPSWRFDIAIEADLIEEVARIGGLDAIAERDAALPSAPRVLPSQEIDERVVLRTLAARGFQEAINFAFIDPAIHRLLFPEEPMIELVNPIAADLSVMRSSLWPGLLRSARENLRRQQQRVRLFEIGTRFRPGEHTDRPYLERKVLAALVLGARAPEQWGSPATPVDFFDLKGDLEALLALGGSAGQFSFESPGPDCLHPGRSARLMRGGKEVGQLGELHPRLVRALDLTYAPILFEVDYEATFVAKLAQFRETSRYPLIRRDISFTVPEHIAFRHIGERVSVAAASLLQEMRVFDVYQGKGVETGRKSVALGLILQDLSRTLTDEEADRVVEAVRADLRSNLDARIRE